MQEPLAPVAAQEEIVRLFSQTEVGSAAPPPVSGSAPGAASSAGMERQPTQTAPPPDSTEAVFYAVRYIMHRHRRCVIVLQQFNGPCPLLALINILSLRGELQGLATAVDSRTQLVTQEALMNLLATRIIARMDELRSRTRRAINQEAEELLLQEALEALPSFARGMDLNVRFTGPDAFEPTKETSVCDALGVRVLHGWLPDPQLAPLIAEIGSSSFNVMVVRQTEDKAPLFAAWSDETRSQLTTHGLFALHQAIAPEEFVMWFRNNHFSVLTKFNGELFMLVSDGATANLGPGVIWQTIADTDFAASEYVGCDFGQPPPPPPRFDPPVVQGRPLSAAPGSQGVVAGRPVSGRSAVVTGHPLPATGRPATTNVVQGQPMNTARRQQQHQPHQRSKKDDCNCAIC